MRRQMIQHRPPQGCDNADTPFGIRAIESGIEVEGVWISRNNTPEPPPSRDPSKSSMEDHAPRKDYSIDLEKQGNARRHDRSRSVSSTGLTPRQSEDRARSINSTASRNAGPGSSSRAGDVASAPIKYHPPSACAKYSGNPALSRQTQAASTIEGIDAIHRASGPINGKDGAGLGGSSAGNGSGQSNSDSAEGETIAASAPHLLTDQERPRKPSTDLDLMHSHRLSQAAETGQLTPRIRPPGSFSEWPSVASSRRPSTAPSEQASHLEQHPTQSPSSVKSNSPVMAASSSIPLLMPTKLESLPPNIRRSSLPDVTPFAKFCQTAPPRPPSASSNGSAKSAMQLVGDSLSEYVSTSSTPAVAITALPTAPIPDATRSSADSAPTIIASSQPSRPGFEPRTSQVLRGHGSGFEILRPGTFATPTQAVEKQRSAPPISMENRMRPRSDSSESRRKLQKKRRPSSESQGSASSRRGSRSSGGW
jgi:hypothetical protein